MRGRDNGIDSVLRGFTFSRLLRALRALRALRRRLRVFIRNIPQEPLLELPRVAFPLQFLIFLRLFKPHRLQCRLFTVTIDTEPLQ